MEQIGGDEGSKSFFNYMISLNPNEKNDLLNMLQYSVLAIIPIIIILKLMKKYIPSENDKKASIEILIELVLQLIIIFASFWFINRLISFIPTYSKAPYPHFNIIQLILPITFILFSMNSTISEKATILLNRTLVAVGLVKENFEDENEKPTNPPVVTIPQNLIPIVSNQQATKGVPMLDQRQQPDPTFGPNGFQGQQYDDGPMAANGVLGGSPW